jgi:2-methylcitrate dehydratase
MQVVTNFTMKEKITAPIISAAMAKFAKLSAYSQLEHDIVDQLKRHLLDSIGSMIFAARQETVLKCMRVLKEVQGSGGLPTPVLGNTGIDRAAQWYTILNRYPDFMDNYLGKDATCHPSDNIGAILAACQSMNASGRDFLITMAVAYQIQCKLCNDMPVMIRGIDHTMLLACSLTAALSALMGLTEEQAAHAIGTAACSFNPAVASRQSYTYEWKGIASSFTAGACLRIVLLAKEGLTGPLTYFEGSMGFEHLTGMKPKFDQYRGDFSLIKRCMLKSYNAEVHTQSSIETLLNLRQQHNINPADVARIEVITFLTAFHIVGGGEYGPRNHVQAKEQADHSLPYLMAVAMLDGQVLPEQLTTERIRRADVQALLNKVHVRTQFPVRTPRKLIEHLDPYTRVYPDKVPTKVIITLNNGYRAEEKREDYKGFFTRPLSWEDVIAKFSKLAGDTPKELQDKIISTVQNLENEQITILTDLLAGI